MPAVTNREPLTLTVIGTTGQWLPRTVAYVRQTVLDDLSHFFDVEDIAMSTDAFTEDPVHYVTTWPYTAIVRLTLRSDYTDHRDVAAIVAHAFYTAGGALPSVTIDGYDAAPGDPDKKTGFSLTTLVIVVVVGLLAIAVIRFE